ncbi:MAG: acylhydrolase, partial [Kamptonema sp. SIO4C4]|nr:acylhydrolase [Kamptonema sp. SIO4C4]
FLEQLAKENQAQERNDALATQEMREGGEVVQPEGEESAVFSVSRLVVEEVEPKGNFPVSGAQFYQQRLAALQQGKLYTRLPRDSFSERWQNAKQQPSHEQWQELLRYEARAIALGQGQNRLNLLVGDSLSAWFPTEDLPKRAFWLNQSISGENTQQIRQRLSLFAETRPQTIYVMAGINDLRQGVSEEAILENYRAIAQQLKQQHPQAKIVLQSLLPTRDQTLNPRIRRLNQALAQIAETEKLLYLNLHAFFVDNNGHLHRDFTTDGIHLTADGYEVWQQALNQVQAWLDVQYPFQSYTL